MKKIYVLAATALTLISLNINHIEVAASENEPEKVIISFKDEIDFEVLDEMGAEVQEELNSINAVVVTLPDQQSIESASIDSSIEYIEEDHLVKAAGQMQTWGYKQIKANTASKIGYTGKGVKIAVVDSGINNKHPDLKIAGGVSKISGLTAFADKLGHGTHVAGIIGAQNNSIGTVGVAPDASLYSIRVLSDEGFGDMTDVIAGIEWAIEQKMDIINLSLTTQTNSPSLQAVVKKAYDQGIIIVAASGNYRANLSIKDVLFPARLPSVIAVGSVSQLNKLSYFSNFGPNQELVAPGENIKSTFVDAKTSTQEDYMVSEGTSMAAPFAAGTFAQYMEAYPHLTNVQLRATVNRAAMDLGAKGRDNLYGHGLVQSLSSKAALFPDLVPDIWYTSAIQKIFDQNITNGFSDGTFRPNSSITRGEAVTMIGRALNLNKNNINHKFTDVPKNSYAAGYINSAVELGYVKGITATNFSPDAPINRGDMAVLIQRIYNLKSTQNTQFSDVPSSKYYYDAVQAVFENNIVKGYPNGTFRPENPITRAENAQILSNSLE
ncbi:S8 family serine peptidase [Planococcus shenhongbingii]|uniref:S8 family peptidase n=1 Tax=Planococcus shenhongbingii TaxID=3058398 RepID=UPI002606B13D|nr:S8 family serine peptidase [Planococcus sp. N016]WKA57845.1 S8 family serine peptidase [Planococcus sp. N016]